MTRESIRQQTVSQLNQLISKQPRHHHQHQQAVWPTDEWFQKPKTEDDSIPTASLNIPTQSAFIYSDSPSNTQSISTNPSIQSPPQSISQITTATTPPTSFRPPPLHPSRTDQSRPIVKETLNAHSTFSERGQKQVNQYLIKREIGRGSFGAVQLAEDAETGLSYAIKELSKTRLKRKFAKELMQINKPFIDHPEDALFLIRNEVAIMKKIRHHNLVKLHEVLDVEGEDSLYMVMEYCPGGSLMRLVQETHQQKLSQQPEQHQKQDGSPLLNSGLDLDLARKYFIQLVAGIDYLHRNEIIRLSDFISIHHTRLITNYFFSDFSK